jgi:hypothetical protein
MSDIDHTIPDNRVDMPTGYTIAVPPGFSPVSFKVENAGDCYAVVHVVFQKEKGPVGQILVDSYRVFTVQLQEVPTDEADNNL